MQAPAPAAALHQAVTRQPNKPSFLFSACLVGTGGMFGASLRVGLVWLFPNRPQGIPWTTFAENVGGAFLLGLLVVLLLERQSQSRWAYPFFCTGLLGSFTTFSNFSLELWQLTQGPQLMVMFVYSMMSIALGLLAALCGMALGRRFSPVEKRS